MTEFLPPEQLEELMVGYVLNDLSPEEAQRLEQLLAENPQLSIEINRLEEALGLLPYALPEVEPPPHLRSTILQAAVAQTNHRHPLRQRSSLSWYKIASGIAALLVLVLGLDNYRLRQTLKATQPVKKQFETLTYSLERTKAAEVAEAKVVVNPNNLEAELTIKNLPPLPPGKVYVLWTVLEQDAPYTTDSKGAILTEAFVVDAQGTVSQTFTVPRVYRSKELISKIAVTVEDAASPQTHKGSPILLTDL
ncbi:anti-sigma factor [Chroococcus sp. FPU101]|uniref:anti-sigma factor n=1 Tax=Chroococcus sp. FPU101 TaxID=1974212 RepID=UPI001A902A83|nr:anti-sigma factor [Chroococcus sp. FPU101]GFE69194.1 hypothetical protein CYB_1179 [Chroococcus sp. FPU101]